MWPIRWKLLSSTFLWYCILRYITQFVLEFTDKNFEHWVERKTFEVFQLITQLSVISVWKLYRFYVYWTLIKWSTNLYFPLLSVWTFMFGIALSPADEITISTPLRGGVTCPSINTPWRPSNSAHAAGQSSKDNKNGHMKISSYNFGFLCKYFLYLIVEYWTGALCTYGCKRISSNIFSKLNDGSNPKGKPMYTLWQRLVLLICSPYCANPTLTKQYLSINTRVQRLPETVTTLLGG